MFVMGLESLEHEMSRGKMVDEMSFSRRDPVPDKLASLRFQMYVALAEVDGSGQGRDPSSQGSNPCRSASRVSFLLHSTQLDFPRSRIKSDGQVESFRVKAVRCVPLEVTLKR